jgi:hypothetical protein
MKQRSIITRITISPMTQRNYYTMFFQNSALIKTILYTDLSVLKKAYINLEFYNKLHKKLNLEEFQKRFNLDFKNISNF